MPKGWYGVVFFVCGSLIVFSASATFYFLKIAPLLEQDRSQSKISVESPTSPQEEETLRGNAADIPVQSPKVQAQAPANSFEAVAIDTDYSGPVPDPYDPSIKYEPFKLSPDEQREVDLNTIKSSLVSYAKQHAGYYPSMLPSSSPKDPQSNQSYTYYIGDDLKSFTVCAVLSSSKYLCADSNISWMLRFSLVKVNPWVNGWLTYSNAQNLYAFTYPSSWKVRQIKDNDSQWKSQGITVGLVAEDSKGNDLKNLGGDSILLSELDVTKITTKGIYTFSDYVNSFISNAKASGDDPNVTIKNLITGQQLFNGKTAMKLSYTMVSADIEVVTTIYLIQTSDTTGIYLRMGAIPSRAFEKIVHSTNEQVLNSVRI